MNLVSVRFCMNVFICFYYEVKMVGIRIGCVWLCVIIGVLVRYILV